jgi:hypothetical protein
VVELKQLIINNVEFNVGNFEEKTITHSTTGEQLKETLTRQRENYWMVKKK